MCFWNRRSHLRTVGTVVENSRVVGLMIAARYFDLVSEMNSNAYNHRLRLVESTRRRGMAHAL